MRLAKITPMCLNIPVIRWFPGSWAQKTPLERAACRQKRLLNTSIKSRVAKWMDA